MIYILITLSDLFPLVFVTQGDAVDMASLMKYVVNNMNQLPTYCYAEENLMSDSRCKSTSTEETPETVILVSSEQTHQCRDGLEQRSMRPPPGFAPLDKKPSLSNVPTRSFNDIYSFGSTSNAKTSSHGNAEVTTNPFLSDQELVNDNVIPKDIAKQIFMANWSENVQSFVKCTEIVYDMLEHSPHILNRNIFENYMTLQHHLKKFLKMFEEALILDNDQSTSSASLNLAKETTDKVGSAQKINTPINSNAESFVNQKLAGMSNLSSNPFGDDRPSQNHTAFSASNGHTFTTNWHQSDGFSPRVQVPSPLTPASACSANYVSSAATANVFFPNSDQNSEIPISPAIKPVFPVISMNADVSNNNHNLSSFCNTANSEFANVFKETNPFRFSMTDNIQIPETQSEPMANSYDTHPASYLSVKNLQDHSLKMEALNINAGNNSFTAAEHVNVNGAESYTPRIVYEAGPVMYNTQKKQTDADVKQNACNSNFKNDRNVSLKRRYDDKELPSQSANDITTSYSKHDSSHIDEGYVTRLSTDYTLQNSQPIISGEAIYHQQNVNANERIVSAQAWKQVEIPERWVNSQLQNGVPLQNHNEKSTTSTSINFSSHKDWNCDNNRESVTRAMIEAMNIKVVFKEIHRSDYPVQFLQLDHYPINVPRDSDKRIVSINLISLQAALSLLHKLKIVTREEIDNAFKKKEFINGSILPNMWTLIVVYRDLKRRIEQYATYGI
ncbi:tudor domain-containing protein 5 [Lasius niger]|uniref:Tudor domain-containing protein 5 n=1 Tax=Lasius niger TaxID=67767 RepID=A0A0J7KI17_LASNI|nr:tudor domain-containing protein 5 [Lasius niger]